MAKILRRAVRHANHDEHRADVIRILTKINIVPVDELKGEKIGVGVNGTIASTADTNGDGEERKTADFTALESNKYEVRAGQLRLSHPL